MAIPALRASRAITT